LVHGALSCGYEALSDKELSLRSQSGLPRMRLGGGAVGVWIHRFSLDFW
jgi:hypothetical protein